MRATPAGDVVFAALLLSGASTLGLSLLFVLSYALKQWLF